MIRKKWMHQGTTYCYNDLLRDIECCKEYGFGAIEVKYNLIKTIDIELINSYIKKSGISIGSVGACVLDDSDRETHFLRFKEMCKIAKVLGCRNITVIPPHNRIGCGRDKENIRCIKQIIKRYLEVCKKYDLRMAFEFTGFKASSINCLSEAAELMHSVSSDNFGLIIDFYHMNNSNSEWSFEKYGISKDNIFIVHISDTQFYDRGEYPDDGRLWPGEGTIQFYKCIESLESIGYDGPVSMEVYSSKAHNFSMTECYEKAIDSFSIMESI